jgi:hypothetical protein
MAYRAKAIPILNDIKVLSERCSECLPLHGFLNDYLNYLILQFTKGRNDMNDQSKIKNFVEILKKWHYMYCFFYDQFMVYFNGKFVGKQRTFFSLDGNKAPLVTIKHFDDINSEITNLEKMDTKSKESIKLQSDIEANFNIIENCKTNTFDQLKKLKDYGIKKLKNCKEMYLRSLQLVMESPKHLEMSMICISLDLDGKKLLRLEPGIYNEDLTEFKLCDDYILMFNAKFENDKLHKISLGKFNLFNSVLF